MTLPPPRPHFAPTFVTNDLVFVSGQLAFGPAGRISGDVAHQTRTCLDNLEGLLRDHGLDRRHVVKTTVWLRQADDYAVFDKTYAGFFGDHRPARSTLICELALADARVEIEAIATRGAPAK